MTHPRKLIRDAFVDRLTTKADGLWPTAAEDRVFASRIAPVDVNDDDELPAILVYTRTDKRDPDSDYGIEGEDTFAQSDLHVIVEAIVAGNEETADDCLDVIAEQVEGLLDDWNVPGFESARVRLGDTDVDVASEGFRRPVVALGQCWHVRYRKVWRPQAPGTRPHTVDRWLFGETDRIVDHDVGPPTSGLPGFPDK